VEEEKIRQKLGDKKLAPFWCSSNLHSSKKIIPLYGRRKNCIFVVFFEQFIHLKENLHYYNLLDTKKFYRRRKHSFIREKIHKNGRSRKDSREEKKIVLCCLLQACHPS